MTSGAVDAPRARVVLRGAWRPVLLSWLVARVIVLAAFGAAWWLDAQRTWGSNYNGLLGWDADWYRRIGEVGYGHLPVEALRFFPVYPLVARAVAVLPLVSVGAALLLLSNGAALLYGRLLYELAVREGYSERSAARVVWVVALVPSGCVMVMGYAEALVGCVLVGVTLFVRSRRWWPAAALGMVAGGLRPTGVLIAVLVVVEAGRGLRCVRGRELLARVCAVCAPAIGMGAYLCWVAVRFGDPLLPLRVQTLGGLRGGAVVNPLDGSVLRLVAHLPWVLVVIALTVVVVGRMPRSWAALTVVTVLLAGNSGGFVSFERVALAAFPLLFAAAVLIRAGGERRAVLFGCGLLGGYAMSAGLSLYIP